MTSDQAQLQSLIAEIESLLGQGTPRLPWSAKGEPSQQRRLLEQALASLRAFQATVEPSSTTGETLGNTETTGIPKTASNSEVASQQVLQALLQEMQYLRSQTIQPLTHEVATLQQRREQLQDEVRQLESVRSQLTEQDESLPADPTWVSALVDQLRSSLLEQLTPQLKALRTPLEDAPALYGTAEDPREIAADLPQLHPQQRLAQLHQIQSQTDHLLLKLDANLRAVFEAMDQSVQSYCDSLAQGLETMHGLGQQGEVIFGAFINHFAQQMRQDASYLSNSDREEAAGLLEGQDGSRRAYNPSIETNQDLWLENNDFEDDPLLQSIVNLDDVDLDDDSSGEEITLFQLDDDITQLRLEDEDAIDESEYRLDDLDIDDELTVLQEDEDRTLIQTEPIAWEDAVGLATSGTGSVTSAVSPSTDSKSTDADNPNYTEAIDSLYESLFGEVSSESEGDEELAATAEGTEHSGQGTEARDVEAAGDNEPGVEKALEDTLFGADNPGSDSDDLRDSDIDQETANNSEAADRATVSLDTDGATAIDASFDTLLESLDSSAPEDDSDLDDSDLEDGSETVTVDNLTETHDSESATALETFIGTEVAAELTPTETSALEADTITSLDELLPAPDMTEAQRSADPFAALDEPSEDTFIAAPLEEDLLAAAVEEALPEIELSLDEAALGQLNEDLARLEETSLDAPTETEPETRSDEPAPVDDRPLSAPATEAIDAEPDPNEISAVNLWAVDLPSDSEIDAELSKADRAEAIAPTMPSAHPMQNLDSGLAAAGIEETDSAAVDPEDVFSETVISLENLGIDQEPADDSDSAEVSLETVFATSQAEDIGRSIEDLEAAVSQLEAIQPESSDVALQSDSAQTVEPEFLEGEAPDNDKYEESENAGNELDAIIGLELEGESIVEDLDLGEIFSVEADSEVDLPTSAIAPSLLDAPVEDFHEELPTAPLEDTPPTAEPAPANGSEYGENREDSVDIAETEELPGFLADLSLPLEEVSLDLEMLEASPEDTQIGVGGLTPDDPDSTPEVPDATALSDAAAVTLPIDEPDNAFTEPDSALNTAATLDIAEVSESVFTEPEAPILEDENKAPVTVVASDATPQAETEAFLLEVDLNLSLDSVPGEEDNASESPALNDDIADLPDETVDGADAIAPTPPEPIFFTVEGAVTEGYRLATNEAVLDEFIETTLADLPGPDTASEATDTEPIATEEAANLITPQSAFEIAGSNEDGFRLVTEPNTFSRQWEDAIAEIPVASEDDFLDQQTAEESVPHASSPSADSPEPLSDEEMAELFPFLSQAASTDTDTDTNLDTTLDYSVEAVDETPASNTSEIVTDTSQTRLDILEVSEPEPVSPITYALYSEPMGSTDISVEGEASSPATEPPVVEIAAAEVTPANDADIPTMLAAEADLAAGPLSDDELAQLFPPTTPPAEDPDAAASELSEETFGEQTLDLDRLDNAVQRLDDFVPGGAEPLAGISGETEESDAAIAELFPTMPEVSESAALDLDEPSALVDRDEADSSTLETADTVASIPDEDTSSFADLFDAMSSEELPGTADLDLDSAAADTSSVSNLESTTDRLNEETAEAEAIADDVSISPDTATNVIPETLESVDENDFTLDSEAAVDAIQTPSESLAFVDFDLAMEEIPEADIENDEAFHSAFQDSAEPELTSTEATEVMTEVTEELEGDGLETAEVLIAEATENGTVATENPDENAEPIGASADAADATEGLEDTDAVEQVNLPSLDALFEDEDEAILEAAFAEAASEETADEGLDDIFGDEIPHSGTGMAISEDASLRDFFAAPPSAAAADRENAVDPTSTILDAERLEAAFAEDTSEVSDDSNLEDIFGENPPEAETEAPSYSTSGESFAATFADDISDPLDSESLEDIFGGAITEAAAAATDSQENEEADDETRLTPADINASIDSVFADDVSAPLDSESLEDIFGGAIAEAEVEVEVEEADGETRLTPADTDASTDTPPLLADLEVTDLETVDSTTDRDSASNVSSEPRTNFDTEAEADDAEIDIDVSDTSPDISLLATDVEAPEAISARDDRPTEEPITAPAVEPETAADAVIAEETPSTSALLAALPADEPADDEPEPPITAAPIRDEWFLGIDFGTGGLSAVLMNRLNGAAHPLYWSYRGSNAPSENTFRLPTVAALQVNTEAAMTAPELRAVGVAALIEGAKDTNLQLLNTLKPLLKVGIPHQIETDQWQPIIQWSSEQPVPLPKISAGVQALLTLLRQSAGTPLELGAVGLGHGQVQQVLDDLQGIVVGHPSSWPDTYCINLREAILAARLIEDPNQIFFIEEAIAAILSGLPDPNDPPPSQGQQTQTLYQCSWQGGTVVISAGVSCTELGIVDLPYPLDAISREDFVLRNLAYGGDALDLDIICQLLLPPERRKLRTDSDRRLSSAGGWQPRFPETASAQWESLMLDSLELPQLAEPDIGHRIHLRQHLETSKLGQSLLEAARHLKLILQNQPQFQLELADQSWRVLRRDLESRVLVPYIQRLNQQLNALLSQTGLASQSINQVICTGGNASFSTIAKWLRQKFPNATIIQDTYPIDRSPSCSRIAYGLVNLCRYPQGLDVPRHQYSDYFLLHEIIRTVPDQPMPLSGILHLLEEQGLNTDACRSRILAILAGHLPPGLVPDVAINPYLSQTTVSQAVYQNLKAAPLFTRQSEDIYMLNAQQRDRIRNHLATLLRGKRQSLAEPLIAQLVIP
ncbi:MAG: hypothetical protein ACFBSF_20170 [Leptolyngbyaceae cyanobacterium]